MSIDHVPAEFGCSFRDIHSMDKLSLIISILDDAERADERSFDKSSGEYNVAIANLKASIGRVQWALADAERAAKDMLIVRRHFASIGPTIKEE